MQTTHPDHHSKHNLLPPSKPHMLQHRNRIRRHIDHHQHHIRHPKRKRVPQIIRIRLPSCIQHITHKPPIHEHFRRPRPTNLHALDQRLTRFIELAVLHIVLNRPQHNQNLRIRWWHSDVIALAFSRVDIAIARRPVQAAEQRVHLIDDCFIAIAEISVEFDNLTNAVKGAAIEHEVVSVDLV